MEYGILTHRPIAVVLIPALLTKRTPEPPTAERIYVGLLDGTLIPDRKLLPFRWEF